MNKEFKIIIEELGAEFETESPFTAFAYITAIQFYDFETSLAQEVALLCNAVYCETHRPINGVDVIDYICANFNDLPMDFNDLCDMVYNGVSVYNL
jgi:hypothetical protein